jgi:SAM-dependent methyltransferase
MYDRDLAYIHHQGFSDFARTAAPDVIALLHTAGINRGLVVDLGCGSGVLAGELVKHGFDVVGIDLSAEMIALAREHVPGASFVVGSLHEVALPPCAAITAIGEPFTYADGEALRQTFARCAAALPAGGLLLFDVIEHVEGETMRYRNWSAEGDDWMIAVDVEEGGRQITRRMWMYRAEGELYRRASEIYHAWTFTRDELTAWLTAAGFQVAFGGWELPPRRIAVQARKI